MNQYLIIAFVLAWAELAGGISRFTIRRIIKLCNLSRGISSSIDIKRHTIHCI